MDSAAAVYSTGGLFEIAAQRWSDWTGYVLFALPLQGPGVLAFFLFGLASVRSGGMFDSRVRFDAAPRCLSRGGGCGGDGDRCGMVDPSAVPLAATSPGR